MTRTGELIDLKPNQVEVSRTDGPAIISLGLTKSGRRQGAAESIAITVHDVVRRLKQWKSSSIKPLAQSPQKTEGTIVQSLSGFGN